MAAEDLTCAWALQTPAERDYHDHEWGRPVTDDRKLFEFVILEGAQAGLSWRTILQRRDGYRRVFAGFDPVRVAAFSDADQQAALQDAGIIRNRAKVASAVNNACRFLEVQAEFGSFARYIWGFVDGRPVQNAFRTMADIPATTPISDALSRDLKRRGFSFMGSTIVYAHMQATGMVNDHVVSCPCHAECRALGENLQAPASHGDRGGHQP